MIRKIMRYLFSYYWMKKGFKKENVYRFMRELEDEHKHKYDKQIKRFAKKYEFFPSTVLALGITKENYKDYLSDYDYWRLFPLDGKYHKWIDNKLELKYLLGNLGKYMPEYYFQITKEYGILKLIDCPIKYDNSIESIIKLLFEKTVLGIKAVEGYGGAEFYKIEVINKEILVNDEKYNESEFENFVLNLNNYLIMEYLECSGLPAQIYHKTANSIRYIIGVEDGKQYKIGNFIKFGDKNSGYVDNFSSGGITCPVDNNGNFNFGYVKVNGIMKEIYNHPDTGVALSGKIEEWEEIEQIAQKIIERLPQLTHLGFDFVISKKGIKILEINDKSGFLTVQKYVPLLKNKEDNFYIKRLEKIKSEQ